MTKYVEPTKDQIAYFNQLDMDQPIYMLNMIRFRAEADYPDTHPLHNAGLSGKQAYTKYGEAIQPFLKKIGGSFALFGHYSATLIGPEDETWDDIFVMHYPSAKAFLSMAIDPDYIENVQVHRTAAVDTSRLIRSAPVLGPTPYE